MLCVWVGLEQWDPDADEWLHLDAPPLAHPGRVDEGHPADMAAQMWLDGRIPDGTYRAVWAPKDRRRRCDLGSDSAPATYELSEDTIARWDMPAGDDETESELQTTSVALEAPIAPPKPPPVRRPAALNRQARPAPATPPPERPYGPHPHEMTPLAQFMAVNALAESQRERDHERVTQMMAVLQSTVQESARESIAAERARSEQMLAFLQASAAREAREGGSALEPIRLQLAELGDKLAAAEGEAEAAETKFEEALATLASEQGGSQAIISGLGAFLQSPAGEVVGKMLQSAFGGGGSAPPDPPPDFDPMGT